MNSKPNVVIIYADDLGYGDLSCYGASDIETPNVDSLCQDGIRFTDAYSTSPVCTPARFSLLTGLYPCRHNNVKILPGDAKCLIEKDCYTLPKLFKDNGYHTGLVGKWHLGLSDGEKPIDWNKPIDHTPLDVGFDECFIFPATADRVPCVYFDGRNVVNLDENDPIEVQYCKKNPFPELPTGKKNKNLLKLRASHGHNNAIVNGVGRIGFMKGGKSALWKDEDLAQTFLDKAKTFVDENKNNPFFLFYALHQPHVPRLPSKKFAGATKLGARGDVIAEMDWCVGEIMDKLKEHNLLDNTIVIFSSDNGPILDDGYADKARVLNGNHRPTGPLRGGKYSKYDGGIRIPFIFSYKGKVTPCVSNSVISQVDLLNSFAAMLNTEIPNKDSQNLLPVLMGESQKGRDVLYAQGYNDTSILRKKDWIYIESDHDTPFFLEKGIDTGSRFYTQLFCLKDDIGERKNLAKKNSKIRKELEQEIYKIKNENIIK